MTLHFKTRNYNNELKILIELNKERAVSKTIISGISYCSFCTYI